MSDSIREGAFSLKAARDALAAIRGRRRGALLVSSGLQDVRLVVEPGQVSVEVAGVALPPEGSVDELVRVFLNCVFWDEPSYLLNPDGGPRRTAQALRLDADPNHVLEQVDRGIEELGQLRSQVPGLDLHVQVQGEPPPDEVDTPSAALFRVLVDQPQGGHLGKAAEEAGLDAIDAAWAVIDLLEAGQAKVDRPPAAMTQRRLRHAEGLVEEGLSVGLRHQHLARGFQRAEPQRAARHFVEAGDGFSGVGQATLALAAYRKASELSPNSTGPLEGQVEVLTRLKRVSEAQRVRERLIVLYEKWAMPARMLRHLEEVPEPTSAHHELILHCLLQTRDFERALEHVGRLIDRLEPAGKLLLVQRFAEAGAEGTDLEKVVALAGIHAERGKRRNLILLNCVLVVLAALLGGELFLRLRYQEALIQTRAKLESGQLDSLEAPWAELSSWQKQVGALPVSCLGQMPGVLSALQTLAADEALLREPNNLRSLGWERYPDVRTARLELEELKTQLKTPAVVEQVEGAQGKIKEYLDEVREKVTKFDDLRSNAFQQFDLGKELLVKHANARFLFAGKAVLLRFKVEPNNESLSVRWLLGPEEQVLAYDAEGDYKVHLPLSPGSKGVLSLNTTGHSPERLEFELASLSTPKLELRLIKLVPLAGKRPPIGSPKEGLLVTSRVVPAPGKPVLGLAQIKEGSSASELAFLRQSLEEGESLRVRVVSEAKPGLGGQPRLYLKALELWVTRGERTSSGVALDFTGMLMRRKVRREGADFVPVEISEIVGDFGSIQRALAVALKQQRKELQ